LYPPFACSAFQAKLRREPDSLTRFIVRIFRNTLCALTLFTGSVFGGVVFEVETTDYKQSPPVAENKQIRVQSQALTVPTPKTGRQGGGVMIFRGDRGPNGEMIVVDHDRKGYFVMDDAAFVEMANRLAGTISEIREGFKGLPEDDRRALEEMLKERGVSSSGNGTVGPKPVIEITATGQSSVVNHYPCAKYEIFRDGVKIRELCTTEWSNIDGGSEASGVFTRMGQFSKGLMEVFSDVPGADEEPNPYAEMNFAEGFPVHTMSLDEEGKIQEEWQLKSTRREAIDPAEFEPPAGYKSMDMSGL